MKDIYLIDYDETGEKIAFESKDQAILEVVKEYVKDLHINELSRDEIIQDLNDLLEENYIEDYVYIYPIKMRTEDE